MSFAENFWSTDFTSSEPYEHLRKRLKNGKQTCDDVISFFKQRALIEEAYSKSLLKLCKSAGGAQEIGTLRASWDVVKKETEEVAHTHMKLASQLSSDLEKTLKEFRERQRDTRKKIEDNVTKSHKLKLSNFDKVNKNKKSYETRCKELDKAEEEAGRGVEQGSKEIEKLRAKAKKARQVMESADALYQESVRALDDSRIAWEHDMERCSVHFQQLEEERLAYLRNTLWVFANLNSIVSVCDDEAHENMRLALEKSSVEEDIQLFIAENKTGSTRPAPINYQNFYFTTTTTTTADPIGRAPLPALPTSPSSTSLPSPSLSSNDYASVDEKHIYSTVDEMERPQVRERTTRMADAPHKPVRAGIPACSICRRCTKRFLYFAKLK